jgi:hypothetical protein
MERLVTDAEVGRALTAAPQDTRAFVRGFCVEHYGPLIHRIGWGRVGLHEDGHTHWLNLHPLLDGNVAGVNARLVQTESLKQVLEVVHSG